MALIHNPTARRAMIRAVVYGSRTGRERGVWFNNNLDILAERDGGVGWAPFYPIPEGGSIFFHVHVLRMLDGYIPGLHQGDLSLGAGNNVMMIIWNTEQRQFWWQDYRQ
jgi:hypothetical protein